MCWHRGDFKVLAPLFKTNKPQLSTGTVDTKVSKQFQALVMREARLYKDIIVTR